MGEEGKQVCQLLWTIKSPEISAGVFAINDGDYRILKHEACLDNVNHAEEHAFSCQKTPFYYGVSQAKTGVIREYPLMRSVLLN